jgi:predicted nucleic-acid-binding protein
VRGLDTNLLVRYLTQDDARQARSVDALFRSALAQKERLHIDAIVLCEIVWVLREAYKHDRQEVAQALEKILEVALFSIEDRDLIRQALEAYRSGRGDFADHLIGLRNRKAGCTDTATFDRALKDSPHHTLL